MAVDGSLHTLGVLMAWDDFLQNPLLLAAPPTSTLAPREVTLVGLAVAAIIISRDASASASLFRPWARGQVWGLIPYAEKLTGSASPLNKCITYEISQEPGDCRRAPRVNALLSMQQAPSMVLRGRRA